MTMGAPRQKDSDVDECLTYHAEKAFKKLGVGRSKGYQLIRSGELPAVKFGKTFLIPKHVIDKLLDV